MYETHAEDVSHEDRMYTVYLLLKRMSPGLYIVRAKTDCTKALVFSHTLMYV